MKVVYIAHPISGAIIENKKEVLSIMRTISDHEPDVVPFAPYITYLDYLNDNNAIERQKGIMYNIELMERVKPDELRLYGDFISQGMRFEIMNAKDLGIKIRPMTKGTKQAFLNLNK